MEQFQIQGFLNVKNAVKEKVQLFNRMLVKDEYGEYDILIAPDKTKYVKCSEIIFPDSESEMRNEILKSN